MNYILFNYGVTPTYIKYTIESIKKQSFWIHKKYIEENILKNE